MVCSVCSLKASFNLCAVAVQHKFSWLCCRLFAVGRRSERESLSVSRINVVVPWNRTPFISAELKIRVRVRQKQYVFAFTLGTNFQREIRHHSIVVGIPAFKHNVKAAVSLMEPYLQLHRNIILFPKLSVLSQILILYYKSSVWCSSCEFVAYLCVVKAIRLSPGHYAKQILNRTLADDVKCVL